MDTGELRTVVPAAATVTQEAAVQAIYKAFFIGDGVPGGKPSVLQALETAMKEIAEIKQKLAEAEKQRLTWKNGIGLAGAGGVLSQAIGMAFHMFKEGR